MRLMEKYKEKKKYLHMVFIDLKKEYDIIPRGVIWDGLKARGISQRYIEVMQHIYDRASMNIHTLMGIIDSLPVKVGLHISRIKPNSFIFTVIMEEIPKSIWETLLWCMFFADDIVLVVETKEVTDKKIGRVEENFRR